MTTPSTPPTPPTAPTRGTRTIEVKELARVEGEGGLYIRLDGERVEEVRLHIFEPPRFFEAFLRGRRGIEAPDFTARICGICPVAYQMSACHAIEDALSVRVGGELRALRRALYCGEWIESHGLHAFLLHLPDFLGYPDAIAMARDHRDLVQAGLRLKKAGNALVRAIGGREIHPVNVRVGGFYRAPRRDELAALVPDLREAEKLAREALAWAARLDFPSLARDYELVALAHPDEYPMNEGRVASSKGLDLCVHDYERTFREVHVERSTALHSVIEGRGAYLTGPLARYHLNFDRLPDDLRRLARDLGFEPPLGNPFRLLLVRLLEVAYACGEALRIIDAYAPPASPAIDLPIQAGSGCAATEAPRGLLYHRYALDPGGLIAEAKIVPPTSQNQASIEADLAAMAKELATLPLDAATRRAEHAIRNHDPCISCATHFLRLTIERGCGAVPNA